jgi:hypothetical protein
MDETRGWALTRLIKLHDGMRDDLALLRRALAAVTDGGQDPNQIAASLGDLSFTQPGWSLQRYCAGFCTFVHDHHAMEDSTVFPMALEHGGNELAIVISKLKADHEALADNVNKVEVALARLPGDPAARRLALDALDSLTERLTAHLAFEEEQLGPALNALSRVVPEDAVPPPPQYSAISRPTA